MCTCRQARVRGTAASRFVAHNRKHRHKQQHCRRGTGLTPRDRVPSSCKGAHKRAVVKPSRRLASRPLLQHFRREEHGVYTSIALHALQSLTTTSLTLAEHLEEGLRALLHVLVREDHRPRHHGQVAVHLPHPRSEEGPVLRGRDAHVEP